ncbi:MAG: SurA N-terminal domain-containing protein [Myxococcales bacterium]
MTTKKTMALPAVLAALLALGAPALTGAAPRMLDRVAAVVNEDMVLMSEVYDRAAPEMAALESEGQATPERKKSALKHALDEVIAERLLVAEERNAGIDVGDQEVEMAVEDVRRQNGMDAQTFERALASKGQSLAAFKDKMRKDLGAMKLIGQKVRAKIKISDEDLKGEYAKQAKLDEAEVEVHARHIVIQVGKDASKDAEQEALKRAEALTKRARAGEDFGEARQEVLRGALQGRRRRRGLLQARRDGGGVRQGRLQLEARRGQRPGPLALRLARHPGARASRRQGQALRAGQGRATRPAVARSDAAPHRAVRRRPEEAGDGRDPRPGAEGLGFRR